MRNDLLAHLQTMHLAYFQHQRIGDLMARMTNDLSATRMMQGPGVMNIVSTSMTFAFTIISMLGVSLKLTLISVIRVLVAGAHLTAQEHRKFDQERDGDDQRRCQRL